MYKEMTRRDEVVGGGMVGFHGGSPVGQLVKEGRYRSHMMGRYMLLTMGNNKDKPPIFGMV